MGLFYVSFAGDKFLGAAVVRANDLNEAVAETIRLGINPLTLDPVCQIAHGAVIGVPVAADIEVVPALRDRLLNLDECRLLDEKRGLYRLNSDYQILESL